MTLLAAMEQVWPEFVYLVGAGIIMAWGARWITYMLSGGPTFRGDDGD